MRGADMRGYRVRRGEGGLADIDDWRDAPRFSPVGADALVMAFDPEPQDAQAFWRAAERAGIACRLFEGDTRFEGYGCYDALARLTDVAINIPEGGLTHPLDALRAPDRDSSDTATAPGVPNTLARPDAIHMHLYMVHYSSAVNRENFRGKSISC